MIVMFVSNFRLYQGYNWVILENKIWHQSDGVAEAYDEIESQEGFELELTAAVLAYEIARSDGEISESELEVLLSEIKKIAYNIFDLPLVHQCHIVLF